MTSPTSSQPRYLSTKETAVLVREQLAACFPSVKFSVRKDSATSILVSWTDGPHTRDVEEAYSRYQGARFDHHDDLRRYNEPTLMAWPGGKTEMVRFGVEHIFSRRTLSAEYQEVLAQAAATLVAEQVGEQFNADLYYHQSIATDWGVCYPGTGHHLMWFLSLHIAAPATAPKARRRA